MITNFELRPLPFSGNIPRTKIFEISRVIGRGRRRSNRSNTRSKRSKSPPLLDRAIDEGIRLKTRGERTEILLPSPSLSRWKDARRKMQRKPLDSRTIRRRCAESIRSLSGIARPGWSTRESCRALEGPGRPFTRLTRKTMRRLIDTRCYPPIATLRFDTHTPCIAFLSFACSDRRSRGSIIASR